MNTIIYYTDHARHRQARRNLSDQDLDFVYEHGRHIYSGGMLHVFLGKRDIPSDKATYQRFARLEGTVLVIDTSRRAPFLITAYRNRRSFKNIRVKTKYEQFFHRVSNTPARQHAFSAS